MLADAKQVRDWKPKKVSEDGPVDSSMANEGDRVIRMTGSDFHKFRNDPVMQFLETFSAVGHFVRLCHTASPVKSLRQKGL